MTPERWQKVKEVFGSALKYEPRDRPDFLARECAGDNALRLEVESLLASNEKDGSFIDSPAFAQAASELLKDDAANLKPGQVIGPYEIVSLLGEGGMGVVYLAEDGRLGRKVALKFLPPSFTSDPDRLRRFEQEARATSALNHPGILTIYEISHIEQTHFIAAEFIEGETLRQRLSHSSLRLDEVLSIGEQVGAALAAAHEAGVLHRDIKPENLMLRRDGFVKILDFGLAKLTDTTGTDPLKRGQVTTSTGVMMGTVNYMSPEQVRGLAVDVRTDIWSLGVVLYEIVAGHPPFKGDSNSDVIVSILEREPLPLKRETPPELHSILMKALAKDRNNRYQTVTELLTALRRLRRQLDRALEMEPDTLLEGGPTSSSNETLPIRGSTKAIRKTIEVIKTNKIGAGLFLLLLVVVLGSAYFIITRRQIGKDTKPELTQLPTLLRTLQVTFKPGFDRDPTLSPDGNAVAYTSIREGSSEIFVKQLAAGGDEIQLTADGEENVEPVWSPDGQRIVFSKNRRGIWIVPALGGVPKQLVEFGSAPTWSRDGTFVAFQSGPPLSLQPVTIWMVPLSGGSPKQITQNGAPPGSHVNPCWSPDSKRIAFAANSSLWSISISGSELKNLGPANFNPGLPVFSPGGEFLYFTGFSGTTSGLWQLRISSTNGDSLGEPQLVTSTPLNSFISRFSVSADGKKIAYSLAQTRGNLYSLPISSGGKAAAAGPVLFTNDTGGRRGPLSFSHDGSKIAFSQFRAGIGTDIFLIDADGKNLTQLTSDPAPDIVSNWFPGGDRIAFISNRKGSSGLWSITLQVGKEEFLLELEQGVDFARVSPDGSEIAFNERKGGTNTIWVMPLKGGERRQLQSDNGPIGYPSWSPDGKFLAVELRRGSNSHVGIIPQAGGSVTQLTNDEGLSFAHSWSPDSGKIAFAGRRNGIWNIYWVSITTKEQQQLTKNTNQNSVMRYPTWSPSGNQIIYEYNETTGNIWLMELK